MKAVNGGISEKIPIPKFPPCFLQIKRALNDLDLPLGKAKLTKGWKNYEQMDRAPPTNDEKKPPPMLSK